MKENKPRDLADHLTRVLKKHTDRVSTVRSNDGTLSVTGVFDNNVRLYVEINPNGNVEAAVSRSPTNAQDLQVSTVYDLTEETVLDAVRNQPEHKEKSMSKYTASITVDAETPAEAERVLLQLKDSTETPWPNVTVQTQTQDESDTHQALARLASAVRAVSRGPGPCFCEHGIGHPLMSSHSQGCQEAGAALKEAEKHLP